MSRFNIALKYEPAIQSSPHGPHVGYTHLEIANTAFHHHTSLDPACIGAALLVTYSQTDHRVQGFDAKVCGVEDSR